MSLPYALLKMIQMELPVRNEYAHLYFNSSFEIDIIVIMFSYNRETFLNHLTYQNVIILAKYLLYIILTHLAYIANVKKRVILNNKVTVCLYSGR